MAQTVNAAFDQFMTDKVRILKPRSDLAKASKNYLISEIERFPDDGVFPVLHHDLSIDYGSFSRKTKKQPLDDIDLMIILHAQAGELIINYDRCEIHLSENAARLTNLCHDDNSLILNSRKVINRFIKYLSNITPYEKAEIKLNQEAATLKLKSYEWVYDIVPCFITDPESVGSEFFLIPDGKGHWKKTDPRIDKERTARINAAQEVSVLDIIRIMKYWTKHRTTPTLSSYFIENLILNYYDLGAVSVLYLDMEIPKILTYIYNQVRIPFQDPKGFQGNINHLNILEAISVQERAAADYAKAAEARAFEDAGKIKESIEKWGEIFGSEFPPFTN